MLFCEIWLTFLGLVITQRFDWRWYRSPAIFRQRFARQHYIVLSPFYRRAWPAIHWATVSWAPAVKAARIALPLR